MTTADERDYRLPRSVEPRRYVITLSPDLEAATFEGEEEVDLLVHEAVSTITLNAAELDIYAAELVGGDGATARTGTVTLDDAAERATVELGGAVQPGEWSLRLRFRGVLNDKLRGFYRSTFTDEAGATRTIATTQFEATDARRAFPCWDEPDRKAVFRVSLVVAEGQTAVSNSPVAATSPVGGGKVRVDFEDTMPMSTYLVAFIVGPLEATDPVDVDGVPLRVVCVPGKEHLTGFARDIGAHALRFFKAYFDVAYPAGKLDLIALPDFAMGAMENLGAVTFRESLLLIDERAATRVELERVADVVAHEIAHMWFGDLVTMKWWNGIWLNEAFATFMELLCVDAFRPEWERWTSFGVDRAAAMGIDALSSTRPIEYPVHHPEEAEQMFDPLTYQKGAGVLRMLERYLGADQFQRGIASYIAKHQYGNTETTDLWDALEASTGEPVRTTMDSWIYQGGHPLVSVKADGATVTLEQQRFRLRPIEDDASRWQVPVLLRASSGGQVVQRRVLLTERSAAVHLDARPDSVVVNEGGSGVYRTRYSPELLQSTMANLGALSPMERFMLVSDTFATVQGGLARVQDFVDLVRLVGRHEDDHSVWTAVLSALTWLDRVTEPETRPRLRAFVRHLLHPVHEWLGWRPAPNESERTHSLRASVIAALGVLGADEGVRDTARDLHASYLADRSSVDPDVAGALVAVVAFWGNADDYATFVRHWREPATPQEELRYLYGLAGFQDLTLVERTLHLALTEVRSQNGPFLIALLLANRAGGELAWRTVKERWAAITERFPANLLDRMLEGVLTLSTPAVAADVHAFVDAHPVPSRARTVEQILERLDVAVAFRRREQANLAAAFARP